MQEEQQSLSSIETVSVVGLLKDRCVRWQVITIVVVNIGMQLSGIDAVSGEEEKRSYEGGLVCSLCKGMYVCAFWMHKSYIHYTYHMRVRDDVAVVPSTPQLCLFHLHLLLSIHHRLTYSH